MNKWIRWQGLVGFVFVLGLIATISLVFMDTWIKMAVRGALQKSTGAEVNIASVSHRFSPFGVTLQGLQLTDPAKPGHNQVEVDTVSADVQLWPLVMHKVVVENLQVERLAFDTERAAPGEVFRAPDKKVSDIVFEMADDVALPSVDDILAKAPLKTTQAVEDAELAYKRHEQALKAQFEALPDKSRLAEYKTRLEAIKKVDYKNPQALAKAKLDFDQIMADLKQDKEQISAFRTAVTEAKADLGPKLAALKSAPEQDYNQLKALAAGDEQAFSDVTRAVFGPQVDQWRQYAFKAFDLLAPMLEGSEAAPAQQQGPARSGEWFSFGDTSNIPELWIKKASVSVLWQEETLASDWQDITHQHAILGRPTLFNIDSSASALWQRFTLDGEFQLLESGLTANQTWQLAGAELSETVLSDKDALSATLQSALLNSQGKLTMTDNVLDGSGTFSFKQLAIAATGEKKLTRIIADALSSLEDLSINAALSGNYRNPDISLSSDLDRQLGAALLNNLDPEQQARLDRLREKLVGQAAGPLASNEAGLGQWDQWQTLAQGDMSSVDDLLKSKFESALDRKKDEVLNKLKDKLFGDP